MIQIRKNVFETNSSSTHSICISKKHVSVPKGTTVNFYAGEYGWSEDTVYDTASYLYTAILVQEDRKEELLDKLESMLSKHDIKCVFNPPMSRWYYIDHGYETYDFVDAILADDDLLLQYLFGDSVIYTGNDNDCEYTNKCFSAKKFIYLTDDNTGKWVKTPNPNHDDENYNYFYKGN